MNIQDRHRGHPKQTVYGDFGPHKAKMVCLKCRCWVKWLPVKDKLLTLEDVKL